MEHSQIKNLLCTLISTVWLFAITAPPILQLLDDNGPVITYTLNEEESKEQEKKGSMEEIILSALPGFKDYLPSLYSKHTGWSNSLFTNTFFREIPLPPPEQVS